MSSKVFRQSRDALRMLAPGPLALVTTMYKDQPNVMTAAWMQPISLSPMLISIAVQPSRLTHEFMTKTEVFTLNFPTLELLTAVHLAGMVSGRDQDKFEASGLTPEPGVATEAPLIAECVAHIECNVRDRVTIGDHDLFVATPMRVTADEEAFNGVWVTEVDAGRVLHHLGADRYAALGKTYQGTLPSEDDD
ncbi:MAG: flavin reductase family protein [Thermomicrobiales bacterium]|nr:flavin reductase family protein [Thermomicrobiales bacterium]